MSGVSRLFQMRGKVICPKKVRLRERLIPSSRSQSRKTRNATGQTLLSSSNLFVRQEFGDLPLGNDTRQADASNSLALSPARAKA
jgi:hypothetical protein